MNEFHSSEELASAKQVNDILIFFKSKRYSIPQINQTIKELFPDSEMKNIKSWAQSLTKSKAEFVLDTFRRLS